MTVSWRDGPLLRIARLAFRPRISTVVIFILAAGSSEPVSASFFDSYFGGPKSDLVITNSMLKDAPLSEQRGSETTTKPISSKLNEVAQTDTGEIQLAALQPVGWVVLVYVQPNGTIVPAKVVNQAGDVKSVDDVADGTVVWVAIDDEGVLHPLQIQPDGQLKPARVDRQGQPVLDGPVPENINILAAQVADDGDLLPILLSPTRDIISVRLTDIGALVRSESLPKAAPEEKGKLSGALFMENSGGGETGPINVTGTVAYEDIVGSGHSVLLSATTSASHPDDSKSVYATYSIPVAGRVKELPNRLSLSAYYYDVDYENTVPNQSGRAKFAINGYGVSPSFTQYLSLDEGADGAQTVQALIYAASFDRYWTRDYGQGQDNRASLVRIPLSVAYAIWHNSNVVGTVNTQFRYTRGLPIGSAGDGDDFRADRTFAEPNYDKLDASFFHQWPNFDGWRLSESIRAQYAREPLVAAEGFSLGGRYSVRGLEESRTIGDSGVTLQTELETPDLIENDYYEGRLFGFLDMGMVDLQRHTTGVGSESAVGTGVGLRMSGTNGLFANFTTGWLVGGSALERYKKEDGRIQLYFSAGMNF